MKNRPIKLLLLEEDESSFAVLSQVFSQKSELPIGVDRVRDIPQALRALKREKYDACVLNCGHSTLDILNDLITGDCLPPITIVTRSQDPQACHPEKRGVDHSGKGEFQAHVLEETVRAALAHTKELEKIQRNEIRFWAKFMMDPLGLALVNAEGQVLFANEAFGRMLGYDQQESMRLALKYLVHPEDLSENEGLFRELMTGTYPQYQLESRLLRKDGSWIRVRQSAIGLVDPETSVRQFVLLSLEEVSERESAAEWEKEAGPSRKRSQISIARESERKLIAQELHDSLGACLSAIKYVLEKNLAQLQKAKGRPDISLGDVIPLVQSAIEETRRISANLWPSILDDQGVFAIIDSFCSEFRKTYSSIEIEKMVDVAEQEIAPALKVVIYRILQEALNNVAKHSGGDLVKISLVRKAEQIELLIADNGCGFEEEQAMKSNIAGMGLNSMKNRVEISGGDFSLESKPGVGTTIRAVWPMQ